MEQTHFTSMNYSASQSVFQLFYLMQVCETIIYLSSDAPQPTRWCLWSLYPFFQHPEQKWRLVPMTNDTGPPKTCPASTHKSYYYTLFLAPAGFAMSLERSTTDSIIQSDSDCAPPAARRISLASSHVFSLFIFYF